MCRWVVKDGILFRAPFHCGNDESVSSFKDKFFFHTDVSCGFLPLIYYGTCISLLDGVNYTMYTEFVVRISLNTGGRQG